MPARPEVAALDVTLFSLESLGGQSAMAAPDVEGDSLLEVGAGLLALPGKRA